MLIVTPNISDSDYCDLLLSFYTDLFGKSPTLYDYSLSVGYSSSRVSFNKVVKSEDLVIFHGTQEFCSEFGDQFYYSGYEKFEISAKSLFDSALSSNIPMIGVNWGMSLTSIKCGFNYRLSAEDKELHLVTYGDSVFAVNSHHKLNILPYGSDLYKYDVMYFGKDGGYTPIESVRLNKYNILSIRWNPELKDCPKSGIDLFSKLLSKYEYFELLSKKKEE